VVVAAGETVTEVPVTAPTFWLMESDVAPPAVHESVVDWPDVIEGGFAVKLEIMGVAFCLSGRALDPREEPICALIASGIKAISPTVNISVLCRGVALGFAIS
jgi:hypothetical protein